MLCPDCGVETTGLVQGSCPRCFAKRNDIAQVPLHVDVVVCASCGARKKGELWDDPTGRSKEDLLDLVVGEAIEVHAELQQVHYELVANPQDERNIQYDVMVEGVVGDLPLDALYSTVVRIKQGVCTSCSRQAGGYFAAIVQIRGADRDPTDAEREEAGALIIRAIDRMRQQGNANSFVTKQGKVKGGHDFFISEIELGRIVARKVADRFDASVEESPKLVGRKNGSDVYRVTFLVRLPPYRTGDFLDLGKGPVRVESIHSKTLSLRDLTTGRQFSIPRNQVHRSQVVARTSDTKNMMVVSVVRDEALLLDPVTNKTHEVLLPDDLEYDLSIRSFDVIEHDGQVYFVRVPARGSLPML